MEAWAEAVYENRYLEAEAVSGSEVETEACPHTILPADTDGPSPRLCSTSGRYGLRYSSAGDRLSDAYQRNGRPRADREEPKAE